MHNNTSRYSAFLKDNLLSVAAHEYYQHRMDIKFPVIGYCDSWTDKFLQTKISEDLLNALDGISNNCFLESQDKMLREWQGNLISESNELSDLHSILDLQKKIFASFISRYTNDAATVAEILIGLEDCYCKLKMHTIETFTNAKKAKVEDVKMSELKFRQIVENSIDVVYTCDFNGYFTYINPAFKKLTGLNIADFIGKHFTTLIKPELVDDAIKFYNDQFKTKNQKSVFAFPIKTATGDYIWIEQTVTLLEKNGWVYGFQGVVRDIEERRRAEEKVRESENFLNVMVESIPMMVFVKDAKDLKFVRFNRAGEELLGYNRNEVIGKTDKDFFPPSEANSFGLKEKEVINSDKVIKIEEIVHTKDNGVRILETLKTPIKDNNGTAQFLLGISSDITERKKLEEQRANLLKDLERKNKELSEFAYIISHDLKSPLRAIGAISDWLTNDYSDKIDDKGKGQLKLMASRVLRMDKLIDSILKYSRVTKGKEHNEKIDLNVLIEEEREIIISSSKKKLDIIIENKLPTIFCDKNYIAQVFENLLDNACQHMDKPEGIIKVGSIEEQDQFKFYVADNGPGIEKKYHEKIFRIFQALKSKDDSDGTGIGLAMVKKIVEAKKGKVWVESIIGEGSTFYFTLPKHEVTLPC